MDKAKLKKLAMKTGLDAVGIALCSLAAISAPEIVPAMKGLEIPTAVAAGIWLYVPLRSLIDKALTRWKR